MNELADWSKWVPPAFLLWKPDDSDYQKPRYDPKKAKFSPAEERARMQKEIIASDGFDIDFSYYRCVFKYHPLHLDSDQLAEEQDTTNEDLLKRLSQGALEDHNHTYEKAFEFVKVVKANFHDAAGYMFLITFQVRDPYDGLVKLFQARVSHLEDTFIDYIFCRPKPHQKVKCVGTFRTSVEKNAMKQRLE